MSFFLLQWAVVAVMTFQLADDRPASVQGMVIRAGTGEPLSKASVELSSAGIKFSRRAIPPSPQGRRLSPISEVHEIGDRRLRPLRGGGPS